MLVNEQILDLPPANIAQRFVYALFFLILWPCKVFFLFKRIFYYTEEIELDDLVLPEGIKKDEGRRNCQCLSFIFGQFRTSR